MAVHLQTAPATGSLPGRVLAIVDESGDGTQAIYEFTVRDDGQLVELANVLPVVEDVDDEIPTSVRESLAGAGYALAEDVAKTDGGTDGETVRTIREALKSAKEVAAQERDVHIKAALGEAVALRARGVNHSNELKEQLVNVLASPDEEAAYFINRALRIVDDIEDEIREKESEAEALLAAARSETGVASTPLDAIATARDTLQLVDRDAVGDDVESRLLNALEELDNILLDADSRDVIDAGSVTDTVEEHRAEVSETPDEVVKRRHQEAGRHGTVPVTIELTAPLIELIDTARDEEGGVTVTNWIKGAVRTSLARHDHEHWGSVPVPIEVELPPETARLARLWADHYAAVGADSYDMEAHLMDYLDLEYEWRVEGGEELDLGLDEDGDRGDGQ